MLDITITSYGCVYTSECIEATFSFKSEYKNRIKCLIFIFTVKSCKHTTCEWTHWFIMSCSCFPAATSEPKKMIQVQQCHLLTTPSNYLIIPPRGPWDVWMKSWGRAWASTNSQLLAPSATKGLTIFILYALVRFEPHLQKLRLFKLIFSH